MAAPYFGSHPTGIVFNVAEYRLIKDRQEMYTREAAYIHPHDLILGKLAEYGEMFQYRTIWSLANEESFASNKSFLYKQGSISDAWFAPSERTKEFELFVNAISKSPFSDEIKRAKGKQIAKRYLFYCTLNYAFYISNPGMCGHYGIEPKILKRAEIASEMKNFISKSYDILSAASMIDGQSTYKAEMTTYFWAIYAAKPIWDKVKTVIRK